MIGIVGDKYVVTGLYSFFEEWGVKIGEIFTVTSIKGAFDTTEIEFDRLLDSGFSSNSYKLCISKENFKRYTKPYYNNETIVSYAKRLKEQKEEYKYHV